LPARARNFTLRHHAGITDDDPGPRLGFYDTSKLVDQVTPAPVPGRTLP